MRLDLLTKGTVVDNAIRFVEESQGRRTQFLISLNLTYDDDKQEFKEYHTTDTT
jgi:hypothetical protein